jgi:PAS domain S-box-containing protein
MPFYNKLGFRFTAGTILLFTAAATLLILYIQDQSKAVLRQQAIGELFDETNLRFREVAAELQALREDVVKLVNEPSVRALQWREHHERNLMPPGSRPPPPGVGSKEKVEEVFRRLLSDRKGYQRIEYFYDRKNPEESRVIACYQRDSAAIAHSAVWAWSSPRLTMADCALALRVAAGSPLTRDDIMIRRAQRTVARVSFSHVKVAESGDGKQRHAFLQACFPVNFAISDDNTSPPGLVVITVDFTRWTKALTRSPRHLVFLAGEDRSLLVYPQRGAPAWQVLKQGEGDTPEHRYFTSNWLTYETGLVKDSFIPTFPVEFRYNPDPVAGDSDWRVPDDLHFLLLRYTWKGTNRKDLAGTLKQLQDEYPNLIIDSEPNPVTHELLVRAHVADDQALRAVRDTLVAEHGGQLRILGSGPLECKRFVRILYKFALGPKDEFLRRCRLGDGIRKDEGKQQALSQTLKQMQNTYPNLDPYTTEIDAKTDEVLIGVKRLPPVDITHLSPLPLPLCTLALGLAKGPPYALRRDLDYHKGTLKEVEDILRRQFGSDLEFPSPEQSLYVAMAAPREEIEAKINDNSPEIAKRVGLCLLIAVALAVVGSVLLTRRLNAITDATQQLAAGKTDIHLPVQDRSEIGVLARSFAVMATHVQERQQEIARREARLQTILDTAAEAILTVGEDGSVRSFNRAAEKLFGYRAKEIVGQRLYRILNDPVLTAAEWDSADNIAHRLRQGQLGECVGCRKDGSTFPVEYGGSRVPLEERTLLTLILRDITQRKQAEEEGRRRNEDLERRVRERTHELELANRELAEARDKAEQVSVAKDFFLATVSHELRTPLNHVLGYIQLLELTNLDEDQHRDLLKIHTAANNLLALVSDILDYQKIIQGVLSLEPASFAIAPWVEEVADAMRPKVGERANRLVVDCPADIGTVEADKVRVRQALVNLLSNAAKFTHDGIVTVRVRREREEEREWLRLDVQDTGRGMTLGQQAKLFQPFTKLLSRSDNPEGTGLGLTLSQKLCRLMGGDLVLTHSEPDQGSTFTIRLPATASTAPVEGPARPLPRPAPRARKQTTVLVIDDDPEVRELMRRHLSEQGFTVHLAASGGEGLEMVKKLRPDAITLDVLMPGIDGWGTLAALQADAETAGIPVIMITMVDDRTRGFALGAWEILPKPISWSRLIDLLRHIEPTTGPVLIVDDDSTFRDLAQRALSQHGWEVCSARDGREALAAAAQRRPALVLLDLFMPVMDGFAFLEAFRSDALWREIPVVVLADRDLSAEDRRRLSGSVQRIVLKGMSSLEELLREVEWLLQSRVETAGGEAEHALAAERLA